MNGLRFAATTLEVSATALWVGASAGFAFISAPLAFAIVADRDIFASLTERTLARLANMTFVAAGIAVAVALVRAGSERVGRTNDVVRAIAGSAGLTLIVYHQRAIVPAMTRAQATMGGTFADVAVGDPKRIAYRALHRRSTRAYGTALLCGIVQLVLAATRNADSDVNGSGP